MEFVTYWCVLQGGFVTKVCDGDDRASQVCKRTGRQKKYVEEQEYKLRNLSALASDL